ncbi:MAG: endonuclease/exonuclease/phosphatase family protein [Candidatus Korobacteraceae bacterium]
MAKFLFWNLNRSELHGFVRNLARQEKVDVLILAECVTRPARLLEELNADSPDYQYAPGNCGHLLFFTRFDSDLLTPRFESHRISIRRLALPGFQSILVAAAHLPSKVNFSESSLLVESVHLAQAIDEVEVSEGHQRTILLGDLNMHPFEAGMVIAGGLHAVMSRNIARRKTRIMQRQKYKFFYNPMWNFLGDRGDTCGTFYFEGSEHLCYYWAAFDQVLLRPELLDRFAPENVRIITSIRGYSLLQKDGEPDKDTVSDHLPVLLDLKLTEG